MIIPHVEYIISKNWLRNASMRCLSEASSLKKRWLSHICETGEVLLVQNRDSISDNVKDDRMCFKKVT